MSRSYWLSIFAIVGWLTLWSQPPSAQGVPSPSPTPEEQSQDSTKAGQPYPPSLPVTIIETPDQAISRDAAEKEGRKHDAKDLDAQIRAADAGERGATAAERQIIPTWLGAILSFVGTLLILATLILTQKSNAIAQDTADRQLRAYVLVEGIMLGKDPTDPKGVAAVVNTKNFGLTPGKNVREWAQIHVAEHPLVGELPDYTPRNQGVSVLPPGAITIQVPTHPALSEVMKAAISRNHTAIYVYGEISYLDHRGKLRTTKYRYMSSGQGFTLGAFRACPEGNDYT